MANERDETREIRPGDMVGYRYLIRDDAGQVLATGTELVHYLEGGTSSLPPAVADRMTGRRPGETFSTSVSEDQAFGPMGSMRRVALPRERFPQLAELPAGQRIALVLPSGDAVSVWVDEADQRRVSLEMDQPFAKRGLQFEISIVSVRIATKDEVASGRPFAMESPTDISSDVAEELATLRDVLRQRFDDEEGSGGLFEILRQDETGNDRRVDALHDAHATLLAQLDEIASQVLAQGTEYDHRPALAALLSELALHDEEGTDLLIDSMNRDVGGEG